jgi:putative Holliday junction resolvase
MNNIGRIVALDVGSRRIGVASCDPHGIVVGPVGVVAAKVPAHALDQIAKIVQDEEARLLVVGLPLTLRGEHGPQAQRVLAFAAELEKRLAVPIVFVDERYTSVEAERIIKEHGTKRQKRRRESVDEVAAMLILEDFLLQQQAREQAPKGYPGNREQEAQDEEHGDTVTR